MVTIVGGKYTTYRTMASDTVDVCAGTLGRQLPASPTAYIPLVGAAGWAAVRHRADAVGREFGVDAAQVRGCWAATATRSPTSSAPSGPTPPCGKPLPGASGYLAAEYLYAATHEQALTLSDVLTRRTPRGHRGARQRRAGGARGRSPGRSVARWDADRQAREVTDHLASVQADRSALTGPTSLTRHARLVTPRSGARAAMTVPPTCRRRPVGVPTRTVDAVSRAAAGLA